MTVSALHACETASECTNYLDTKFDLLWFESMCFTDVDEWPVKHKPITIMTQTSHYISLSIDLQRILYIPKKSSLESRFKLFNLKLIMPI